MKWTSESSLPVSCWASSARSLAICQGSSALHATTASPRSVADFCGKEEYEAGDLSREIGSRVESRVLEFTGNNDYSFGDISQEIERRRVEWVQDFLGKQVFFS